MQQGNPVGVDVADDHLQLGAAGHQGRELLEVGLGEGGAGGVDQERGGAADLLALSTAGKEQKAVGRRAALQAVLDLKAQALGAEAPQADQARFNLQLDDLPFCSGAGHQ